MMQSASLTTEPSDSQLLAESARAMLGEECPIEVVRRHVEADRSAAAGLWRKMAELGWLASCAPEASGGLALGVEAIASLCQETGRALAPAPLLSALLAIEALALCDQPARTEPWIAAIMAGELRAAVGDFVAEPQARLVRTSDALRLDGEVLLHEAADAELLLLLACAPDDERALVVLDAGAPGVDVVLRPTIDATRTSGTIRLAGLEVAEERCLPISADGCRALLRAASLGIAADAVGGAEAILERTIEYLKVRQQFGRAIGSFQALKHRVADHSAALTGAQALLSAAVDPGAAMSQALEAKALATQVYLAIARDCIQLHGGIGFTWEYPAHLYLKRALLDSMQFGTIEATLDRLVLELAA